MKLIFKKDHESTYTYFLRYLKRLIFEKKKKTLQIHFYCQLIVRVFAIKKTVNGLQYQKYLDYDKRIGFH